MTDFTMHLQPIRAFVFDVDGVFTDGSILLHPMGEFLRTMNIKDGFAVQHAIKMGYHVAIITGGYSRTVRRRFTYLGIKDIYMKSLNKTLAFDDFCSKHNIEPRYVAYMGDDLPDYEVMQKAGLPACPANAAEEIRQIAKYVSYLKGGEGCVRDIIEKVLRLHGKWMNSEAYQW